MLAVSRVSDTGSHGGNITTGNSTILVDGLAIATIGSNYNCVVHGNNPIVSSPITTVKAGGIVIAMIGSVCQCGSIINSGSSNVNV